MRILDLTDPKVKSLVRHHPMLKGLKRIARGSFCAVYDKGDTVVKLTCDRTTYAFSVERLVEKSVYFPRLVAEERNVGEMCNGTDLHILEMEKLTPFTRNTPVELKRAANGILNMFMAEYHSVSYSRHSSIADNHKFKTVRALQNLGDNTALDPVLRHALDQLAMFCANYDCGHDFQRSNLMLRGDQIVFNDVVADIQSLIRAQRAHGL